jgi:hypothetical protein
MQLHCSENVPKYLYLLILIAGFIVSPEAAVNALADVAMSSVGGFGLPNLSGGLWHSHGTLSVSSSGAWANRTFLVSDPGATSPPHTTHT